MHPRVPFSFSRFLIPELAGYEGRALYLDSDMLVFGDIAELATHPFDGKALLCTSQPETPPQWRHKGDFFKPGRHAAVMLYDCSRLDWKIDDIVRGLDDGRYDYDGARVRPVHRRARPRRSTPSRSSGTTSSATSPASRSSSTTRSCPPSRGAPTGTRSASCGWTRTGTRSPRAPIPPEEVEVLIAAGQVKPSLAEALRTAGTRADGDTALELAAARHRITELEGRLADLARLALVPDRRHRRAHPAPQPRLPSPPPRRAPRLTGGGTAGTHHYHPRSLAPLSLSGIRVGWKPFNYDARVPSVRFRSILPIRILARTGIRTNLVPADGSGDYDCVIFQKSYTQADYELAQEYAARGVKVVFDLCDNHFYAPGDQPMLVERAARLRQIVDVADVVTVSTPAVAELVPEKKVFLVDDALEVPRGAAVARLHASWRRRLARRGSARVVWFGNGESKGIDIGLTELGRIMPDLEAVHRSTRSASRSSATRAVSSTSTPAGARSRPGTCGGTPRRSRSTSRRTTCA